MARFLVLALLALSSCAPYRASNFKTSAEPLPAAEPITGAPQVANPSAPRENELELQRENEMATPGARSTSAEAHSSAEMKSSAAARSSAEAPPPAEVSTPMASGNQSPAQMPLSAQALKSAAASASVPASTRAPGPALASATPSVRAQRPALASSSAAARAHAAPASPSARNPRPASAPARRQPPTSAANANPAAAAAWARAAEPSRFASALPIPAWARKPQSPAWTTSLIRALKAFGRELVTAEIRDATDFCPAYPLLAADARVKVWVQLISAMAKYESDLNPVSAFVENFRGPGGSLIVSRGLLQISKASGNFYGCQIRSEADLENPDINLACGVRILNSLVPKYHAIHGRTDASESGWLGAARYWSVLRGRVKDELIRRAVQQMSICAG